ncbi:MAG: hypothetical protein GW808_13290 [Sphingomonadales bacterium]|nr:hypothetical protein [Sphingomonadales bacterium]NCO49872.1 hypothetical protein [Sphingomonadales bacterium]NCP01368.1 hypothetical protein [Sphingomonadales bacterium]NCP25916.1 hypothetical protein [Sphingomonadales bacterium]NCP43280.1 hypothetical protein [Sphingomonadales bacterium]
MEQYANSLIRKDHKLAKPIANNRDNSEQVRELRELQRNLADRIRKIQRGA